MSRYIDADKLSKNLTDMAKYQEPYKQSTILGVVSTIENTKTADVVEVRHGYWKETIEPLGAHKVDCVECSACGDSWVLDEDFDYDLVNDFWNFCPTCGAKMDGERKNDGT